MKIAVVCNNIYHYQKWLDKKINSGEIKEEDEYYCVNTILKAKGWIPDKIIELWGYSTLHNIEIINIFNRYKNIPFEYQDW